MSWNDVVRVLDAAALEGAPPDATDDAALRRRAAAWRKRYERIKERLRARAEREGLVSPRGSSRTG
jgi:hypothetical protein